MKIVQIISEKKNKKWAVFAMVRNPKIGCLEWGKVVRRPERGMKRVMAIVDAHNTGILTTRHIDVPA